MLGLGQLCSGRDATCNFCANYARVSLKIWTNLVFNFTAGNQFRRIDRYLHILRTQFLPTFAVTFAGAFIQLC